MKKKILDSLNLNQKEPENLSEPSYEFIYDSIDDYNEIEKELGKYKSYLFASTFIKHILF